MIELTGKQTILQKSIDLARRRGIIVPTFKQMADPEQIPDVIKERLRKVGLWEVNPLNLFRITWKNEPVEKGGLFNGVNAWEIPPALTGVRARIVALIGKWFPTGAHKVGATFGCLVPPLVTGRFDPTTQKAVWPSTGNFCRGGAYNSALLGCDSIAILPEGMSRERFEWLKTLAGEVIATPGSESNVKEIYDKCWELRRTRSDVVIFNQFEEFGNYLWHYQITGRAMDEVLQERLQPDQRFAGVVLSSGSAGTLGCADYLKQRHPTARLAVAEALQCPTLLLNGYGSHRIEGIGDKHVPWIHNVRNTDMVVAVDDTFPMALLRLFNEPEGQAYLVEQGFPSEQLERLGWIGISGLGNLVAAVKFARYYELTERDAVLTVFTDSMALYGSRIEELRDQFGPYRREDAVRDYHRFLLGIGTDHMLELDYYSKKRIHHLKYFTWVEQQGKTVAELDAQWYDYPDYWERVQQQAEAIDAHIEAFNQQVGLLS